MNDFGIASKDASRAVLSSYSQPASLRRRLGAVLYEALLLIAMALVIGFLFLPLITPGRALDATLAVPSLFARVMLFCALAGAGALYYVWCWTNDRRTLPQKTWRLRVVARDDNAPSRKQALVRYAAGWIGPALAVTAYAALRPSGFARYAILLAALNYVWPLFDPDRQFLHDRISGTRVVNA